MGVLNDDELQRVISFSPFAAKYNDALDRESAYEILQAKINNAKAQTEQKEIEAPPARRATSPKEEPSALEKLSKNTMVRQVGNTVIREVARGLLGVLGLGGGSKKKKGGLFG
jgi:hypothetical protein